MNVDELVHEAGGLSREDTMEIVRRLVARGLLDYIDLDIAVEPDQMYLGFPNYLLPKQIYRPYVDGFGSGRRDTRDERSGPGELDRRGRGGAAGRCRQPGRNRARADRRPEAAAQRPGGSRER